MKFALAEFIQGLGLKKEQEFEIMYGVFVQKFVYYLQKMF